MNWKWVIKNYVFKNYMFQNVSLLIQLNARRNLEYEEKWKGYRKKNLDEKDKEATFVTVYYDYKQTYLVNILLLEFILKWVL